MSRCQASRLGSRKSGFLLGQHPSTTSALTGAQQRHCCSPSWQSGMPFSFVSKVGGKRRGEQSTDQSGPAQASQQMPPPPRLTGPPPLPSREEAAGQYPVVGAYGTPPLAGSATYASQPIQRYDPPQSQPVSAIRPTSLSPPPTMLQRSPSPQSLQVLQPSLSGSTLTSPRTSSPSQYPAPQPSAPSPHPSVRPTPSSRPSATREPPKIRKILSLDGGGVRGLSIIKILKYIMQELNRERGLEPAPLDPWQEFDMIGGTSTGG